MIMPRFTGRPKPRLIAVVDYTSKVFSCLPWPELVKKLQNVVKNRMARRQNIRRLDYKGNQ